MKDRGGVLEGEFRIGSVMGVLEGEGACIHTNRGSGGTMKQGGSGIDMESVDPTA